MQKTNHNHTQRPSLWPQILIAALTLAAVAAAILFGRLTYRETRELATEQFNQQQLILARSAAAGIEGYLDEINEELPVLAAMSPVQAMAPESLVYMQLVYSDESGKTSIRLLDVDGILRFIYPNEGWRKELIGQDYSEETYFIETQETGERAFSGVITNEMEEPCIRVAYPVFIEDEKGAREFNGVVVASFDIEEIARLYISPIVSGETGYAWLLDEDGVFLAHYKAEFVGWNASEVRAEQNPDISYEAIEQIQRRMLSSEEGTGRYISGWHRGQYGEVEKLAAYTPVHVNGRIWSVAVCAPVSEVDALVRAAGRAELYTLGLVILALMAGGVYLLITSRRWSHSLEREVEKRTEALRESETNYSLLAENVTDLIWVADMSLRFTYISPSVKHMLGYSVEEAMSLTLADILTPVSLETIMKAFAGEQAVEETGTNDLFRSRTLEVEAFCKDGSTIWTEVKATGLRDPDSQLVEILGVSRDITERRRAAEELHRKEEHHKAVIENIFKFVPEGVLVLTESLNLLKQNKAFDDIVQKYAPLLGYTEEELAQKIIEQLRCKIESEDSKEIHIWNKDRSRTGLPEGNQRDELVLEFNTARIFLAEEEEEEEEASIVVSLKDITERRWAEHERECLLEQISLGRARLEILSKQLLEIQEAERRTIALELHDRIGQDLAALKLHLQSAKRLGDIPAFKQHMNQGIATLTRLSERVRELALDLRPSILDDLGLVAALRWYIDRQTRDTDLRIEYDLKSPETRPETEIETTCFRVAQEALTNILRHAQATQVHVALASEEGFLRLVIQDDGIGFDSTEAYERALRGESMGLLGMRERVELSSGDLKIDSSPGGGTILEARFPFTLSHPPERRESRRNFQ
ncbi:MAG: PAS domain S-box protein [Chloroflexota bacterium]